MAPVQVLLWMVWLATLVAGLLHALHRLIRPRPSPRGRSIDALRDLEPRGGRHRVSVRLFEVLVLAQVWLAALHALLLFAPIARNAPPAAWMSVVALAATLLIGSGWAWRRGVLRQPEPRPAASAEGRERPW